MRHAIATVFVLVLLIGCSTPSAVAQGKGATSRPMKGVSDKIWPVKVPTEAEVASALTTGVALLLEHQENYKLVGEGRRARNPRAEPGAEGEDPAKAKTPESKPATAKGALHEWPYEGVHRVAGDIPPGYRVGGTCIVCWSLMEAPGFATDAKRREAVVRGLTFAMDELDRDPMLSASFEGGYDTRGWGHAYGLLVLLRALDLKALEGADAEHAGKVVRNMVRTLEATEIKQTGGWNYSRPGGFEKPASASTFMTAPTLQALFSAKAHGIPVKADVIDRALKTLEDARIDGKASVQYGTNPSEKTGKRIEDEPGSCARTAVCEVTLMLAGKSTVERIRASINAFFQGWQALDDRRAKNGTHEGPYAIAPYFFHFGHTYCAQAIEMLPEAERPALRTKLHEYYWRTREANGSWNDRVFPRSAGYGTAMTMLGLLMPTLPHAASYKP